MPDLTPTESDLARDLLAARQRIAALEAALEPFAEYARRMDGFSPPDADDSPLCDHYICAGVKPIAAPTLGDCRKAMEVLKCPT